MVPEAALEKTEEGLVPAGEGWFVLNAREARWFEREGQGVAPGLQGRGTFGSWAWALMCSRRGSRWRCTTGRPIRRTSSCSPAKLY